MLAKILSLCGAGVVLVAYAANQMGRMESRRYPYLLLVISLGGILFAAWRRKLLKRTEDGSR